MRFVDLTQTFTSAMPVYPGDSLPRLIQSASLENDGASNFELTTSMHVGTHVDGPAHMIPGGERLCDYPPETFFGKVVIVDARGQPEISAAMLNDVPLARDMIVLVCTGWAEKYGTESYYQEYPAVTLEFARALVNAGVKMVGFDSPSPDHPPFLVHKVLLNDRILIIENLTNVVGLLGEKKAELVVAPLKIEADSAPARVIAMVG
ncbi:MAG: cyclase family protein [Candidatus Magasanikbacteria bacterium]|nr:cyclase family protein [Candidatus Magasanikbacteria bacterium]